LVATSSRLSHARSGGREHERRWAVPIVGGMVLREGHELEPVALRPHALLERRRIDRLGRWTERRRPQVVAQRQPHAVGARHHALPPPLSGVAGERPSVRPESTLRYFKRVVLAMGMRGNIDGDGSGYAK
jgi:hypothetical protein